MRKSTGPGAGAAEGTLLWVQIFSVLKFLLIIPTVNCFEFPQNPEPSAGDDCPTALWNFGDSLTDTGGTLNVFPSTLDPERSPYGETFFGRPAKRWTNGRVVPDFFALAFERPLLQPYVQAGAFDYRFGANFASAGTTASNDSATNPIFLAFQVAQYVRLKQTATSEKQQFSCSPFSAFLPRDNSYSKGLYTITIGGNDILNALLLANLPPPNITTTVIPQAMINIANAIETLYRNGARKFMFFNNPNAGCSTIVITLLGPFLPTDAQGCVTLVNDLDQAYNFALNNTIAAARVQHPDAVFTLFNYYAANEEILNNPAKYRFNPALTQTACCGAPGVGTLNYNPLVTCGNAGSNNCANPDEYVNWDGVHFTDAFYRTIAKFALDGQFTDTGFNYTASCHLRFSDFGPNVTFDSVYGNSCKVTFTS